MSQYLYRLSIPLHISKHKELYTLKPKPKKTQIILTDRYFLSSSNSNELTCLTNHLYHSFRYLCIRYQKLEKLLSNSVFLTACQISNYPITIQHDLSQFLTIQHDLSQFSREKND